MTRRLSMTSNGRPYHGSPMQENWFNLRDRMGEDDARRYIVDLLEGLAQEVKDGADLPFIYGFELEDSGKMKTLSVTLADFEASYAR